MESVVQQLKGIVSKDNGFTLVTGSSCKPNKKLRKQAIKLHVVHEESTQKWTLGSNAYDSSVKW